MNQKMEKEIRRVYPKLRRSEKKVADYLLNCRENLRELTLDGLAGACGVSQPTVLRFVKALGCAGFRDFRYELAESGQDREGKVLYGFSISRDDTVKEVPALIIGTTVGQIEKAIQSITPQLLERAVRAITGARRIAVYYVENSSCTAQDLVTKLMYLGIHCYAYGDAYMQSVSAAGLEAGDVAIGISYSGYSRNTVDAMEIAKGAGATTIAITNFEHTLLERFSDLVLCTSSRQFLYGDAIFSRATQLVVVDMLYVGILLSDYSYYTGKLDESGRLIRKQAYGQPE